MHMSIGRGYDDGSGSFLPIDFLLASGGKKLREVRRDTARDGETKPRLRWMHQRMGSWEEYSEP